MAHAVVEGIMLAQEAGHQHALHEVSHRVGAVVHRHVDPEHLVAQVLHPPELEAEVALDVAVTK